jgi:hypothetical protein
LFKTTRGVFFIGLVEKMKKNNKKAFKKKGGMNTGKKDLSKLMYFDVTRWDIM